MDSILLQEADDSRLQVAKPLFDGTQQWKKWSCEKRKLLEEAHPSFVSLLHGLGYGSLKCAGDEQN